MKRAVEAFYAALATDDAAAFAKATTDDFYAFEGERFTAKALFDLIVQEHRNGRVYVWNVGPVDARIDCRVASAVWRTTGSSGVPPKIVPRAWLESGTLIRENGRWVLAFLHSTPDDPGPQAADD